MSRYLTIFFFLLFASLSLAQTSTDIVREALIKQGNPEFDSCSVTLLPSAREKYDDMFAHIRQAKRFVHLEYFIFRLDSIGSEMIHLLHEKAQEGVEIRLLLDAYGNWKAPNPISNEQIDSIRSLGIMMDIFDPLHFPFLQNMLHRDHRKIVVVDGLMAWTGGMNVADYYIHGTDMTGPWRDMQARYEGTVVDEFERIFARIWEKTTHEHLDADYYKAASHLTGEKVVSIVNREPKLSPRQIRQSYIKILQSARNEVRIVNPYPTNTHSVRRAMRKALDRGLRLKIMVSTKMDNRFTPEIIAIQMNNMMRRGAEVYYYEGGFHHSKVLTVDDEFCSIGTANLDGRSMRFDYEVNTVVFDPEVTRQLNDIFDNDVKNSQLLTRQNYKKLFSRKRRFVGRVFQFLKAFL